MQKGYRCVNGLILKIIAMAAMLADHMGAILYPEAEILRVIGRIAFPVFVFLMVEGFYHTGNIRRYELRLLLFAAVSEIPFDLAFSWRALEFTYQNIFFTLFLGLLMLDLMQRARKRVSVSAGWGAEIGILIVFMAAAYFLRTDYGAGGVLFVYIFYRLRGKLLWLALALFAVSYVFFGWTECPAVLAMIPLFLYNGQRGFGKNGVYGGAGRGAAAAAVKYLFYLFYPLHLLILAGIRGGLTYVLF